MRAAEILANALLETESAYAIVFGPGIPKEGYWVSGSDFNDLLVKVLHGQQLAGREGEGTPGAKGGRALDHLISLGYILVTDVHGQIDGNGQVDVYGYQFPRLSPKAIKMLGIQASSEVNLHKSAESAPQTTDGKQAFRIAMTPEEERAAEQEDTNKEASRLAFSQEDEQEFAQWQLNRARNTAQAWRKAQSAPAPAAAPPTPPPQATGWSKGKLARWLRRHTPGAKRTAPSTSPTP